MKIALLDNMNNNFFSLARYLRDHGIDAHLFWLPGGKSHFTPQADTTRDVAGMDWVHEFPFNTTEKEFRYSLTPLLKRKLDFLHDFDLRIACGSMPAFLFKCSIPVDVFIPYGADLYQTPFTDASAGHGWKSFLKKRFATAQSNGIANARVTITNTRNDLYRESAEKLGVKITNIPLLMVYTKEDYSVFNQQWSFLDSHDFVVFNHSRHIWKSNPDNLHDHAQHGGTKRNDKVIRAFARFVHSRKARSPLLVTFEYGPDVSASKQLTHELGIEGHVRWMPQSSRISIMAGLSRATLACDQFRVGMCGPGGTGFETMGMGIPLLTHTEGAIRDPEHPFYNAPIIDLLEEEDIFKTFTDCAESPLKYKMIGKQSRQWFDEHLGDGLAKRYIELFESLLKDKPGSQ